VLGDDSLISALIATLITVCLLFAVSIVLAEIGLQKQSNPVYLVRVVSSRVLTNPLILAPLVAVLIPLFHVSMPTPVNSFLKLLGNSAAPCALVTLGLFLGSRETNQRAISKATTCFVACKLLIHPIITWVLAAYVFKLPPFATYCATLLAALPTGTGPFMLAEHYGREAHSASGTILLSTALSPLTLMVMIEWFS